MIIVLKCKWSGLECFKICEKRLWNCPYCVITVAPHRSNCEGGGGGDELNLKVPGTLPAELSWSGQHRSITEDFRIWRFKLGSKSREHILESQVREKDLD